MIANHLSSSSIFSRNYPGGTNSWIISSSIYFCIQKYPEMVLSNKATKAEARTFWIWRKIARLCKKHFRIWIWVLYILHEAHNSEKPQMGNSMELWNSRLGSICSTNQLLSTSCSLPTYRNTKHNCLKISYLSWMGKVFRKLQNPLWNWPSLYLYILILSPILYRTR